jgi:predicted transcriptional regulator
MSSFKQQLVDVVSSLPDDCTEEDFRYRLYVRQRIEEGLDDIDHGRTHSHEEVVEMVQLWRKSYGPSPPQAT